MLKNRIANPYARSIAEWLLAIGLAILFFLVARNFLFRMAHVTGNSMEPTLSHGDMVVLNRLGWLISGPRIGDIVAFPYRADPEDNFIKRVVGLPGDIIHLSDGAFYVNGTRLADDFSYDRVLHMGDAAFPVTVEEGALFVLGDNRNGSKDSRFTTVGNVPVDHVVGRVSTRVWPLEGFGRP
ncbi:MAG: signal peptidase I [Defluviitaleaceae bacterium]|nr:signal peptidase I [Defluviitaleaceae bacterium]MCL2238682.1 signal peptidase I [Defluviitaleaceae bacterium]